MYALDTNGSVTSWNPGAERTKGYAKTEIIGQHFSVFFTAEDQANGKPMLALETARQTGRFEDEGWRVRKDGQRFWASVVLEPIIDYDGVLVGFAKITRDITERLALDAAKDELLKIQQTERVRAEARVREVEGELVQIHRFTAVGEMASTLAHEINQPLTAITNYLKGCARILDRMDGEHVPALRGAVNEAANQALRAGDIIRHMRQFLARGEIEPAAEDLPALLAESVHVALLAVPPGYVEIVFDLAEPSRLVMVDRVQTQQVLLNLIRNAIEAMAESPRRLLVLKTGEPMPDGLVKISVADTGTGLLPHVRDNLFQTFVSSKENGMGLGLSICRTIVESHGGRIWVETSSEEGTTFSFTLRTL
jgi:PAS domain S-box-containing protein